MASQQATRDAGGIGLNSSALADGSWYASGAFWGAIGAVAAIAAVVVSLLVWVIGPPRRRLSVRTLTTVPLLSRHFERIAARCSRNRGGETSR
jgi:hypothetical protein